jgi:hypothetical protein
LTPTGTQSGTVSLTLRSTLPAAGTPCPCPADFNGVGGVGLQDLFDYLTAWFSGSDDGDFNSIDGVTVGDLFDFLAAWFAGCP